MSHPWVKGSPCHRHGENVMKDKFRTIVPDNGIVQIFDLISEKEQTNTKGCWLIVKHATFCTSRWHGSWFAEGSIYQIFGRMTGLPSQGGNNEAAECVNSEMTSQNVSIDLQIQQWMEVLSIQLQNTKYSVTSKPQNVSILLSVQHIELPPLPYLTLCYLLLSST